MAPKPPTLVTPRQAVARLENLGVLTVRSAEVDPPILNARHAPAKPGRPLRDSFIA